MRRSTTNGAPIVTYSIMALCVLVFIAEAATGLFGKSASSVEVDLLYYPPFTFAEPWRMVTYLFVHASITHILFNMFSLYVLGTQIEHMVGRVRYIVLFLLAGIGGAVAVLLISPSTPVEGASGAIFGLFGAYFVIARHLGANSRGLIIVIGLNLVIGFVVPGIAWQAHVGGLIVGALIGLVYTRTRKRSQRWIQYGLVAAVAVALFGVMAVAVPFLGATG